jgi:hypothetical protein
MNQDQLLEQQLQQDEQLLKLQAYEQHLADQAEQAKHHFEQMSKQLQEQQQKLQETQEALQKQQNQIETERTKLEVNLPLTQSEKQQATTQPQPMQEDETPQQNNSPPQENNSLSLNFSTPDISKNRKQLEIIQQIPLPTFKKHPQSILDLRPIDFLIVLKDESAKLFHQPSFTRHIQMILAAHPISTKHTRKKKSSSSTLPTATSPLPKL